MVNEEKLKFWDSRSGLGEKAGTNDFLLKRIELKLLLGMVSEKAHVLDVGCGNGDTLIQLVSQKKCRGRGIDFSPGMIKAAKKSAEGLGAGRNVLFEEGHLPGLRPGLGEFDYVITERCLINLDDIESQHAAFLEIMKHVKRGGCYLMIEDSHDGLDKLNAARQSVGLELMSPPWHNTFLHEKDVLKWQTDQYVLEDFVPFTSTYYFLSRVVYARLAKDKGEELKYDSDINLLATGLPNMGNMGAVRLWVWKRK